MEHTVIYDRENECFRVHLEGEHYAVVRYQFFDKAIHITSTKVPQELQGKGYGKIMMESVLPLIETQGFKIVPVCSYVKHYLDRHPQWQHLRA